MSKMFQILNEKGELNQNTAKESRSAGSASPAAPPAKPSLPLDDNTIRALYEKMLYAKIADQKALNLQRQGRMGTYASCRGQEAIQIASAAALQKDDWMVPAFRELAAMWAYGMPLKNIYLYWMGNEWGSHAPPDVNMLPISIPVGTHMVHAVGIGMAINKKKSSPIVMTYFGDGGTSEGDFHEAMNFAGLYHAPVVFICQNNQYAISVPRSKQTASATLAQKAEAYGFEGIQVDGNDVIACYQVCKEAVEKARGRIAADGTFTAGTPTLIEAVTYRLSDHTTADDASKYRDGTEHENWKKKDPLLRVQKYLAIKNLWSEKIEQELIAKFEQEIQIIAEETEKIPLNPADIFDYTYAELTPRLREQKKELLKNLPTISQHKSP